MTDILPARTQVLTDQESTEPGAVPNTGGGGVAGVAAGTGILIPPEAVGVVGGLLGIAWAISHIKTGGGASSGGENSGAAAQPPDPDDDSFERGIEKSCPESKQVQCEHVDYGKVPEEFREQARKVIESMDTDGSLPEGVRQGGQRGRPGIYGGQGLPKAPKNYYVETDISPTESGGRRPGSGRLVFGGKGDIWYTNHYDDGFVQIRGPHCGC
jgi:hypothetical protein